MYITQEEKIYLELLVDVYNINPGFNQKLMSSCPTLKEYMMYTSRVRQYAEEKDIDGNKVYTIEEAVERAITECIEEGILAEFLSKNRAEAKHMSIYEYDEEKHMRMEREEHYEKGHAAGFTEGLTRGAVENLTSILRDLGEVPKEILRHAEDLDNAEIKNWTKLAARANSMEEFLESLKKLK